jgi:Skp family chaperone for outer membrane proteins
MSKLYRLSALAFLGVSLCAAVPAAAQEKPGPAYVDLTRVLTEYRKTTAFQKLAVKMREQGRTFNEEMRTLAQVRYCTEPERKEALAIKAKPTPTPAETKRLEELTKKTDAIEAEHATLSQKQKPTDADTKRLQDIAQMRRDAVQMMAKEEADRRDAMRKMDQDLLMDVQGELLKMVEKLAKDQKYGAVYNRTAVLFGGVDLTDQVIKKLPK